MRGLTLSGKWIGWNGGGESGMKGGGGNSAWCVKMNKKFKKKEIQHIFLFSAFKMAIKKITWYVKER